MTGINGAEPPPQPQAMLPMLVPPTDNPTIWSIQTVPMADGSQKVMVQIHSAKGIFIDLMDATAAMKIAGDFGRHARQMSSGLILPPGVGH